MALPPSKLSTLSAEQIEPILLRLPYPDLIKTLTVFQQYRPFFYDELFWARKARRDLGVSIILFRFADSGMEYPARTYQTFVLLAEKPTETLFKAIQSQWPYEARYEMVLWALSKDAKLEMEVLEQGERVPINAIILAVQNREFRIANLLISSPQAQEVVEVPHLTVLSDSIATIVRSGSIITLEKVLERGVQLTNENLGYNPNELLGYSAQEDEFDMFLYLYRVLNATPNIALDEAAQSGNLDIVIYVLDQLHPTNFNEALLDATRIGKIDLINLLIEHGANNVGESLDLAVSQSLLDPDYYLKVIRLLVEQYGADVLENTIDIARYNVVYYREKEGESRAGNIAVYDYLVNHFEG